MDVKTTFLNGSLDKTIYMVQPKSFIAKGQKMKVCELQKSIYGLKQAFRSWNIRFDLWIKSIGLSNILMNPVCTRDAAETWWWFLVIHEDDIPIIENNDGKIVFSK